MNLEDQLRGDQSGAGSARLTERIQVDEVEVVSLLEDGRRASGVSDPYGPAQDPCPARSDPEARALAVLEPGVSRPASRSDRIGRCGTRRVGHAARRRRSASDWSRRSPTTSSATGRSSGSSPTTRSPRSWSTAFDRVFVERNGQDRARRTVSFVDDDAPPAHHRQDRLPRRPARRRGLADGRRAPARRQPRQRDHPAALARRADC